MRLAIADPPYLGRAVRWYGAGGCGDGHGKGQADNHPDAHLWDHPETHRQLARQLLEEFDGFAIALTVHSLSTYLDVIETDSRNGIRVAVWHKPASVTSGSRISNHWEPVIFKIPKERRSWKTGPSVSDVMRCNPPRNGFVGAKPIEWTQWVLEVLGATEEDEIVDLFYGSGAVTQVLSDRSRS